MNPVKVLVADDDEAFRSLMTAHLRRQGFEVESAADGLQALDKLRNQGPFAVLVTDLMMPGLTGLELLREAHRVDSHLEGIIITAAATMESAISAIRDERAFDYLLKPLETISELSMAVGRAVEYRRLRLEREALQAQVLADAERIQALIAHTGDAIISADSTGVLRVVNPAAARLLGREDLLGADALSSLPAALARLIANWQTVGGRRPVIVEFNWPAEATQMVSLTPVLQGGGETGAWVMVVRDITHLKRLEDLKQRTLAETASRLQVPLAQAIGALAELSKLPEVSSGRAQEMIYRLVRLWGRIQEWMDDLMALVRLEAGVGLRPADTDVAKVIRETTGSLAEGALREMKLQWALTLADDLVSVRADPEMLRRSLQGVMRRAAGRSAQGDVIKVAARLHEDQVWIEVTDQGPAVSEGELQRAFEIPAGGPSLSAEAGPSFELATVKTMVDRMGGQVWLHGEPSAGSSVVICLPAATLAN